MKILLTGAGGQLGMVTRPLLEEAGWEVRATDLHPGPDLLTADLCDWQACRKLTEGVSALVHLGNISHQSLASSEEGYLRNTSSNFNLFQAAAEAGVSKIVFASSIQVYGMDAQPEGQPPRQPPYFPIDEETPEQPCNWYGLSKLAGEHALAYFAALHPRLETVSIRFPLLVDPNPEWLERLNTRHLPDAWRILCREDAARLLVACLRAHLPGHRAYLPAHPGTVLGMSPERLMREHFPSVPLRRAPEDIHTLIDISRITRETGWHPQLTGALHPL